MIGMKMFIFIVIVRLDDELDSSCDNYVGIILFCTGRFIRFIISVICAIIDNCINFHKFDSYKLNNHVNNLCIFFAIFSLILQHYKSELSVLKSSFMHTDARSE